MLRYLCLDHVLQMVRQGMHSDRSIVLAGFPITSDRGPLFGLPFGPNPVEYSIEQKPTHPTLPCPALPCLCPTPPQLALAPALLNVPLSLLLLTLMVIISLSWRIR